jgi:AraC family transcriptional regulator, regulatory protein of adaptative response / DNA-3-methyladenine glycosylase II
VLELVPAHPPYDARRMLWFLGMHATPGLESYADDGRTTSYARVLRLPGGPGVVRLELADEVLTADLRVTGPGDEADAQARLSHLLDLAGDPAPALDHLAADPLLDVRARPGLRAPGSVDHVETLVRTMVGQQISLASARAVTGRLVRDHGRPLPAALVGDGLSHAFPAPEVLAALEPADLPMPRTRGRSVVAVAQTVAAQGDWLVGGTPEAKAALLALPGVGPWTASYQALRAGRDPDSFLATDLAVRRALEAHGVTGGQAAIGRRAERWAPFRSLALMHLWFAYLEGRGVSAASATLRA